MKKILISIAVLSSVFFTQSTWSDDKTLSRSCLKNNPLVVGETDTNLIEIYSAYCDKKNIDAKYSYLAKAAQRFQQIGKNWKALQLINELEALNLKGNTITDVKFLASANLANEALTQIRTTENRYLTSDVTYPVAKQLVENIESAKSSSILQIEKPIQTQQSASQNRITKAPAKKSTRSTTSVQKNKTTPTAKAPATRSSVGSNSGDPFGFTKK